MSQANNFWLAGEAASERKDIAAAEGLYRKALAVDAQHSASLIGLSTVLSRRGKHREAHESTLAAYRARPSQAPLIYAVAQRLRYFHEFEKLVDCLSWPELGRQAPATVLAKSAVMLSSIGAHAEARRIVDIAVGRDPRCAAALHVRGNFHLFEGKVEDAKVAYEASLLEDPALFQNSLMLAGSGVQTELSNHVARLEQQLRAAKPNGTGEVYLAFALHKELHDLKRHDQAWAALARGCAAKRRQLQYSTADTVALVDALTGACTEEFLASRSTVRQPHVPIFIVGMHRSGTTLLERMLAGHSQVGDAGETSSVHAQLELAIDRGSPMGIDARFAQLAIEADFDRVAHGYADHARWLSRGKPFFTEKLPQNFFNIGFIAKAIPQARFIHLVRDPVDTCFSNLRTLFSGAALYSYVQEELGDFFVQYRRMMRHWQAVAPGLVLDVPYARLVEDPEATARLIARHCGLEFEAAMVDIGRSSGTVSTPSATVARQGFRKDRGRAWEPYREHLQPLMSALGPDLAPQDVAVP